MEKRNLNHLMHPESPINWDLKDKIRARSSYKCQNCTQTIWNFVPPDKLFSQIGNHIYKKYGSVVFKRWKKGIKNYKNKPLCPRCCGYLSLRVLEKIVGHNDNFIKKWFMENWENL